MPCRAAAFVGSHSYFVAIGQVLSVGRQAKQSLERPKCSGTSRPNYQRDPARAITN